MKSKAILISFLTVLTTTSLGLWLGLAQAAGSATLTLAPASGSYVNGSNFTVVIKENSSDQINTVQANLSYDQSKLQFVSIDTSTSTFNYPLAASGGNGSVSVARGVDNGATVSGSQTVASVTFKVLVGSGSSPITFASSSAVVRPSDGTNVWDGTTTGGTYSFTTPPPPPTPPSSTTTTTTTTNNTTPATGSTSSKPANPPAGTSTNSGSANSVAKPAPSIATQTAKPADPVPVTNSTVAPSGNLVAIKVVDSNEKPISGAKVTLADRTTQTDATGIASFSQVASGPHDVEVRTLAGTLKSSINVSGDKAAFEVQQFEVLAARQETSLGRRAVLPTILLFLVIFTLLFRNKVISLYRRWSHGSKSTVTTEASFAPKVPSIFDVPSTDFTDRIQGLKVTTPPPRPGDIIVPNNYSSTSSSDYLTKKLNEA